MKKILLSWVVLLCLLISASNATAQGSTQSYLEPNANYTSIWDDT